MPPIPRAPVVINELVAAQQGDRIILSIPLTRTPRSTPIQRIDIYRLTEPTSAPPGLTTEDFSARSTVVYSIPAEKIPAGSSTLTWEDHLDLKNTRANTRYRYAVRLVNPAGRPTDFSNYAMLPLLVDIAQPPTNLQTQLSERQIDLTWSPPVANESGTSPANVAGYNVYRRASGGPLVKLNPQPLREPHLVDRAFQFGAPYEYIVRSISPPPAGADPTQVIESNASAQIAITPKDIFPPAAPGEPSAVSVNRIVSLFWPPNPEPDIAGYNIYRSEDEKTPPSAWTKLNARLHEPITFRDERVQVGKRYFYQITAVDTSGNESPRSVIVSEVVNP